MLYIQKKNADCLHQDGNRSTANNYSCTERILERRSEGEAHPLAPQKPRETTLKR